MQEQSERTFAYYPGLAEKFGPSVFLVLTIFLMVGVVSTPWVNYLESSTTYYLAGFCDHTGCHGYSGLDSPFRDVFPATYGLTLMALVFSVLELVALVLSIFWTEVRPVILVTGVLSSTILLVAAIYFYFGVLVNMSREPWATGGGWFGALLVVVFLLMATIVGFFAARSRSPALASND